MTKLFVNVNRKDFAVIQISLQNLKLPQYIVYKMPLRVQPSSKLTCFHLSGHRSINWSRSWSSDASTVQAMMDALQWYESRSSALPEHVVI
jgi:hypothetical protein